MIVNDAIVRELTALGSRQVFGKALAEIAPRYPKIRAVVADVMTSAKLTDFAALGPERLINVGIAEQNMIGVASGLANEGYQVYTSTFAPFASLRCFEMLRTMDGYMNLDVKTVGLLSGLTGASFGSTHFGIDDLSVTRTIPNMTVVSPADCLEVYKVVEAAAEHTGPMYIRLTGDRGTLGIYKEDYKFEFGKANILHEGKDIAIIGTGSILGEAVRAARGLKKYAIDPTIVNMHTIKPLDTKMLDQIFAAHQLVVTVEEHFVIGGLGSAVAEYKASLRNAPPQLTLGIRDEFPHAGSLNYIRNEYGITAPRIVDSIVKAWQAS